MKPYERMLFNENFFTFAERIPGMYTEHDYLTDEAHILLEELVHVVEIIERRKVRKLLNDVICVISMNEDIPIERLQVLLNSVDFQP